MRWGRGRPGVEVKKRRDQGLEGWSEGLRHLDRVWMLSPTQKDAISLGRPWLLDSTGIQGQKTRRPGLRRA